MNHAYPFSTQSRSIWKFPYRRLLPAGEASNDGRESIQVGLKDHVIGEAPPFPARLEIFNHLVHGPDQHVWALEDFVGRQLGPAARQFSSRRGAIYHAIKGYFQSRLEAVLPPDVKVEVLVPAPPPPAPEHHGAAQG